MHKEMEKDGRILGLVGEAEGARRATGASQTEDDIPVGETHGDRSDPEVLEKPARRRFSAEYKLAILREADACTEYGAVGALLRREGLYSSHLTSWRKQRDEGSLKALSPSKRGRKPKAENPLSKEVARLERENRNLQKRLDRAELIIDVQKKVAKLLGIQLNQPPDEEDE